MPFGVQRSYGVCEQNEADQEVVVYLEVEC